MMNIIAIDVASEVSAVCVSRASGKIIREELVPTKISELKRIIRGVPAPRQVVFEEGTQAAWLWSELIGECEDVLVCDPVRNGQLSGEFKSDRNDSRNLALRARTGVLKRVWHGGEDLQSLRESVREYQALTQDVVRQKNRLKAVFRSSGSRDGKKAYEPETRKEAARGLRLSVQRERVQRLGQVLDATQTERRAACKTMVNLARKNAMYKALRTIDGIGPVFASMFISEVGVADRFRTRAQLWSYGGLAVTTQESSEYELCQGSVVRRSRPSRTRGLTRAHNRTLKYVFKQGAMILSRTKWKAQYEMLLKRTKNPSSAQLTLARKLATVMLYVAKTGEKYDVAKVFAAQQ